MQVSGVTLDRKTLDLLPPKAKIRPLGDRIIVKPLDWEPSKIIQLSGNQRKPLRGVITATGPGRYYRRYLYNTQGERDGVIHSDKRLPIEVKVGDIVELGGLTDEQGNYDGYNFPQISIGNELHLICQEQDVCMVRG